MLPPRPALDRGRAAQAAGQVGVRRFGAGSVHGHRRPMLPPHPVAATEGLRLRDNVIYYGGSVVLLVARHHRQLCVLYVSVTRSVSKF